MRLIDADRLPILMLKCPPMRSSDYINGWIAGLDTAYRDLPTVVTEPTIMCDGYHIKCPADKDYERGYKDGKSEALMMKRQHGHWIDNRCSICNAKRPIEKVMLRGEEAWHYEASVNYCPNCGAKMW